MITGRSTLAAFLLAVGLAYPLRAAEPDPKGVDFFETKVRPILVEKCYSCHSAQAKKLRGNLLLDSRAGWTKGGDSGPAIVPGDPDRSLLVQGIRYDDPELKMPPKGKLPAEEVATLVDWVKRGAPDPRVGPSKAVAPRVIDIEEGRRFWSLLPLSSASPPPVRNAAWCRNPIDRFILAKLEADGVAPNRTVDRRALIRRASFELVGLPPMPEAVDRFVEDTSPDAYERLLDDLLNSPHYGERWGRHWLDIARFAESHGFEHDTDRPTAYPYRDFVIKALNQDLPFDTFVKWQISGDELAPENPLALAATGFLAAGVHSTQITANQVEKERYDELDDIAATMGTAMLGLTIGCARCHDHKYDPIPQRDYYRLLSTFTTTVRTEVDLQVDPDGDEMAKAAFEREHAPYLASLVRFEAEQLPAHLERWEANATSAAARPVWTTLDLLSTKSRGGASFTKRDDGSYLAAGTNPDFDTYTFVAEVDAKGITALRLEVLADPSFVKGGPGRAANGNFDLTNFRVTAAPKDGSRPPIAVDLRDPLATFEQPGLPIKAAIDGDAHSGWAVDPQFGKNHAAVFATPPDFGFEGGTVLTFTLDFQGNNGHNIGRPRLSVTTSSRPAPLHGEGIPQSVVRGLDTPRSRRTPEQTAALLKWFRAIDPEWQARNHVVQAHASRAPKPKVVKALISSEGLPALRLNTQGGDFLEKTHFLKRGDPNQKQEEATQSFLQVLMNASDGERHWRIDPPQGWRTSYRRASLASWITDPDEGAGRLLARVVVNRLWQHQFGRGIVATPSDFGAQGERPTHPELLDWLAAELIRGGWRLKPIHRLIMTSATYLQDARVDELKAKIDHENKLFWRQQRRRLDAEIIRDAMLAVGGQLDATLFGPGTLDDHQRRRSVYFTIKRSRLIPMLMLFDAPDALQGIAVRPTTTIAPQSLMLMNSPIVRGWASGFADRVNARAPRSQGDAVRLAYRIALGRLPNPDELDDADAFLDRQRPAYAARGLSNAPALALTDFCQVLMSLNEFIYVE